MEKENIYCHRLQLEKKGHPILGRLIKDNDDYFILETGGGKKLQISKKTFFILEETNIIFERR